MAYVAWRYKASPPGDSLQEPRNTKNRTCHLATMHGPPSGFWNFSRNSTIQTESKIDHAIQAIHHVI